MAEINQADVELKLDCLIGINDEELLEAFEGLQDSDLLVNLGGANEVLGEICQKVISICKGQDDITEKSKKVNNIFGNEAKNMKTFFETTINQLTSVLNDTYNKAQNAKKNKNVVEYYSLLQSSKGQAETLQTLSRKFKEKFGELPQIDIGNGLYKSEDLNNFITDLEKASKAQKEFISQYSELKKQLANTSNQARKDLLNNPIVSSMFKNSIASLGKEFKTLAQDINNNVSEGNFNGIEEKIKKLANYKAAINELMDKSGISSVGAKDTAMDISVKKDGKYGINTKFNEVISNISSNGPDNLKEQISIFQNISNSASEADENVLKLIEDCFGVNGADVANKISPFEAGVKKLKKSMRNIADLSSSATVEDYQKLVDTFDEIAHINFEEAKKQFEDLAKSLNFMDPENTIKDFEEMYVEQYGLSFYNPQTNTSSNDVTNTNSSLSDDMVKAAQEAQKQAEAEVQQYKSQVDNLESQLASKDKELEAINKKVNDLRNQLNKASENSSSERVAQLESEIEKKNKEKTILENEINTLRSQLSEAKTKDNSEDNSAEIEELQKQISAKTKENEDLKKTNKELQDSLIASSSDMISGNNNQKIIEQIKKRMEDYDTAFNNDDSLEQQRQILIEINDLYNQLSDNEKTSPDFDYSQSKIQEDLRTVNELIEEQNQKRQEEIRLADEAKIKESELYKEIIRLQNQYTKEDDGTGKYKGLEERTERKKRLSSIVNTIASKKSQLKEKYPDFDDKDIWSDELIAKTQSDIKAAIKGNKEKKAYIEQKSVEFVETYNRIFDDLIKEYNEAGKIKTKYTVVEKANNLINIMNNVPTEKGATENQIRGSKILATVNDVNKMVKKYQEFIYEKQTELQKMLEEAAKAGKVTDQAKSGKKSTAKNDSTTPPSVQQPNSDTTTSKPITSSKEFVETMTNRMNKKKSAKSEKTVNEENTDFSKLGTSIEDVTLKINKKTEAIKTEGKTVTEVVNGEVGDFERLRKKIEEVTGEINNKNGTLENDNTDNKGKKASKPSKTSDVKSNTDNITDNNINNINPFKVTDIIVTEEAKAKLNTEISNAIATIYISDVKLADGVLLSDLQKEISDALNVNPVEVQVVPNINNDVKEEKTDGSVNGVSINISSINFANEEVASALKARIEDALSPIFIRQVNGENADISSLENRISLALNVIKIDRVELNENFDASSLQKEIEKYLSAIKITGIDTSELAQSIKTEIESVLAQLKAPQIKANAKFTDADQTKFTKLTTAIDNFSKAVERKNQAVDSFIGNEAANIDILLGKIKELKEVISSIGKIRVLYEKDVSKDTDSNTGADSNSSGSKKDDKKIIDVTNGSDNSSKKQSKGSKGTKDKKEVATQKEKKKLLEEELKIKTKIIPIEEEIKKITEQKENAEKNNNQKEISQLKAQLDIQKSEKNKLTNELQDIKTKKDIYGITKQDEDDFIETKYKKINTTANNEQNTINKSQKNIGIENTKIAKEEFNKITDAITNYDDVIKPTIDDLAKLNSVTKEVIESNQAVRTSIKNNTGENALDTKYERLIAKMKKWASDNPLAMKDDSISKKYNNILNQLTDTSKRTSDGIAKLEGEFNKLDGQIHETGQTGRTFTGEMKNLFNVLGDRAVVSMVIEGIKDVLRQMVNNVKEIDAAMTELKKVTNETSTTYNKFLKEAGTRASALGSTMTDLISSTADFAKLGYSVKDAAVLAENAIMYSNVGDLDIQTATSDLVSATKAFGIEAENVTKIVDSFNEVGNNYAISAQQIGEALQNSASSLVVAGNDIDQSIAMITAMTEITQDAASAGAALKIMSLRIRGAKVELEEMGESTDDVATSTSKLRAEIKAMTNGFDIMKEGSDTEFKSTYEIMAGLAEAIKNMDDISKTALIEKIAGKNRANIYPYVQKCA